MSTAFPSPAQWERADFVKGNLWIKLTKDFIAVTSLGIITVPKDFWSDGASVPQFAWSIVGHPFSGYLDAAIVHDFLYSKASDDLKFTRRQADFIMRELMWNLKFSAFKVASFYLALRVGGGFAYKKR